jgi:hypothetical protein
MQLFITFTRSLLLAVITSFLAPIALFGTAWLGMQLWSYLPVVGGWGLAANHHIAGFLTVFGNGSPISGMLTIAMVCAFVGALFDTYAFYHAQVQKNPYSNAIDH